MTAIKIEKLVPRVVFATPFRLFAIYISLFCAAVAATFIYVTISTQGFLNHEAEAAVNVEYENLAARYRDGGLPSLVGAISEHSASSSGTLLSSDRQRRQAARRQSRLRCYRPLEYARRGPIRLSQARGRPDERAAGPWAGDAVSRRPALDRGARHREPGDAQAHAPAGVSPGLRVHHRHWHRRAASW